MEAVVVDCLSSVVEVACLSDFALSLEQLWAVLKSGPALPSPQISTLSESVEASSRRLLLNVACLSLSPWISNSLEIAGKVSRMKCHYLVRGQATFDGL